MLQGQAKVGLREKENRPLLFLTLQVARGIQDVSRQLSNHAPSKYVPCPHPRKESSKFPFDQYRSNEPFLQQFQIHGSKKHKGPIGLDLDLACTKPIPDLHFFKANEGNKFQYGLNLLTCSTEALVETIDKGKQKAQPLSLSAQKKANQEEENHWYYSKRFIA